MATTSPVRLRRTRGALTTLLVLLACIAVLLSTIAGWAHRLLWDSDRFAQVGATALTDEAVATALGDHVAGEVTTLVRGYVDLDLPESLAPFATRFDAAVQAAIATEIRDVVTSDGTRRVVETGLAAAHRRLLAAIADRDAVVTIDLLPIIGTALEQVQDLGLIPATIVLPDLAAGGDHDARVAALEAALDRDLPDGFGRLTIYDGTEVSKVGGVLDAIARVLDLVHRATVGVVVATIALSAAALAVSPRRGRTAVVLVLGSGVALYLGAVIITGVRDRLPGLIEPATRDAALALFDGFVSGLLAFTRAAATVLMLLAVGALGAARLGRADGRAVLAAARRAIHEHGDVVRLGALGVSLLVLAGFGLSLTSVVLVGAAWAIALALVLVPARPGAASHGD